MPFGLIVVRNTNKVLDPTQEFDPHLLKDKEQIERLRIKTSSSHLLEELFVCIPPNLTHIWVPFNGDESLLVRENYAKIMDNITLLKCKVYGKFCWKFEEITDRNKQLKNEERFKVMKVAPQDPEVVAQTT